jgi:hypothetical protein
VCLAIYKPSGVIVPHDHLEEGFVSNPHSAGFAVVDRGHMRVFKGFYKYAEFLEAYLPWAEHQALIHFRWATHGTRGVKNCHPFWVTDETVMIHNGVLDIDTKTKPKRSDTWHYVDGVLAPMAKRDPDFFLRPEIAYMGSQAISGSKFCFLRRDGQYGIWNEEDGHWESGVWYSNKSYKSYGFGYGSTASYIMSKWHTEHWEKKQSKDDDDGKLIVLGDSSESRDDILAADSAAWAAYAEELQVKAHNESRYLSNMHHDQQFEYEDLLEMGYSIQELDDMIQSEGVDAISELHYHHSGERS